MFVFQRQLEVYAFYENEIDPKPVSDHDKRHDEDMQEIIKVHI